MKHDGTRWAFGPGDRTRYPCFLLVVEDGRWAVKPVVSEETPMGAWFSSGRTYRLSDGRNADGADLVMDAKMAQQEADRRNRNAGTWEGKA